MENLFLKEMKTRKRSILRFNSGVFNWSFPCRYDPTADFRAHSNAHKRTVVEQESYLSKEQLKELQRVQRERVELAKRKQLGLEIKQTLGVRMDGNEFED